MPINTGTVLLAAVFTMVMSFAVDVACTLVDPRVRLSRR
jgi:ABC-type dipeptide/oligopeptide/nickel transport system permease component